MIIATATYTTRDKKHDVHTNGDDDDNDDNEDDD